MPGKGKGEFNMGFYKVHSATILGLKVEFVQVEADAGNGLPMFHMMGYVLYDKMQVFPQFNSALVWLTKEEQSKFQYVKGDTEGFVNIPLSIKNIIFSVFLREDTEKNMIKVSLRSVGAFPCNKVAAEFFNGGGHLNASGGEFYGTMDEAIDLFKQALVKYEELLLAKK